MQDYLTIRELCAALRISRATAYRLRQKGWVKFVKLGGSTRVSPSSIRELVAKLESDQVVDAK